VCAALTYGPSPARAATRVEFTALLTGKATITGAGRFAFAGGGTSSPYGPVRNAGGIRLTGVGVSCVGGLANTNVERLSFVGGDTLTIRSLDVACPVGVMKFRGTGTWTVTGGTGRFARATGSGSAVGGANFVARTFRMRLQGTITGP
jgi:hypothetical protein